MCPHCKLGRKNVLTPLYLISTKFSRHCMLKGGLQGCELSLKTILSITSNRDALFYKYNERIM